MIGIGLAKFFLILIGIYLVFVTIEDVNNSLKN